MTFPLHLGLLCPNPWHLSHCVVGGQSRRSSTLRDSPAIKSLSRLVFVVFPRILKATAIEPLRISPNCLLLLDVSQYTLIGFRPLLKVEISSLNRTKPFSVSEEVSKIPWTATLYYLVSF